MVFTEYWFQNYAEKQWQELLPRHFPYGIGKALEIGSYEGASACYLLRHGVKDLLCVDTWAGSDEPHFRQSQVHMNEVRERFTENVENAVKTTGATANAWQLTSTEAMNLLLANGMDETFDFIYIDGSHVAADVLSDGLRAFRLLRHGGWIYFDDYNWINPDHKEDPSQSPAAGIDAFIKIRGPEVAYERSRFQMHVQKL